MGSRFLVPMKMQRNPVVATFQTRDLAEAATLLTFGKTLIKLERVEGRYHFVFADPADCAQHSADFWAGKLRVNPRELALRMRELKDRIHIGR